MQRRSFFLDHYAYSIGDTVYYVIGQDAVYSVKKTRIIGTETRRCGLRIGSNPVFDYIVYRTEDGRLISQTAFRHRRDEMDPSFVFRTKEEAARRIKECLQQEINRARHALFDAQERLAAAERVLKVYEKYGK